MMRENRMMTNDTTYLRQESLRTVLVCAVVGLYVWCAALFHMGDRFGPAWMGPALVIVGLAVAFSNRNRNAPLAAAAVIVSFAAANVHSMWLAGMQVAPYTLAVVVSLTGLLFDLRTVTWATILASSSIVAVGSLRWDHSPVSVELLSPVLVVGAVGISSSLAVRNLYQALYWFRERAMAAQRNEQELRERQGQLNRTLKALDEAYRRLEYLNYDLARAREAAAEARLNKQRFATSVSHELRTPLNVIVAFSETMYLSPESYGGVPLPADYRGDVREIYRSSKHLLHLIDDVLDMSQIEAGRMRIDLETVELRSVIFETLDMIRPLVREGQISLHAEVQAGLPAVSIDRARVQQVLLNLLNNARRFTEQGSITVEAALEVEQVRVTVADTGIGIPPEEHQNVFKEFHQVEGALSRRQNGSGLGLAISKRFVEMQGGRIWLESDGVPGHGSRFHFTLPVAGTEQVEVSISHRIRKLPKPPSGRGRTLLVLGQDPATVQMLERGLEEHRVVLVEDPSAVPGLASELHAQAVVLNSAQGGQAGRHMHELRQRLGRSSLPIILCPLVGERQVGQALGVEDYLVKPITREVLAAMLDRIGEGVSRILVVDDDPQMTRILSRLIQATGREVEVTRAYNGREGLRAMRSQRPDLVLLDLVMPEMDGYDLLVRLQEDVELRDIPVVVITAQVRTPDEERQLGGNTMCVSAGAGFTNQEVLAYLRGVLDAVSGLASPQSGMEAEI
jgi:signal transduction histidine kinase/CheY-like chemotaxis protein